MAKSEDRGGGLFALILVFIGAVGFAASLTAVYRGMRDLMINAGGNCSSGGPYAIAAGHQCSTGQTGLLMGGILIGLVFAGILAGATGWYSDSSSTLAAGMFMWAALFGALGYNFLALGLNPPSNLSGNGTGWVICGIVFILMALGGLIPGLLAFKSFVTNDEDEAAEAAEFESKIVRANVPFVRSMPGDPAFGQTHPGQTYTAQTYTAQTYTGQPAPAAQAPLVQAEDVKATNDFVDPVTGERVSVDE